MQFPSHNWHRPPKAAAIRIFLAALACIISLSARAAERQLLHGHVPAVVQKLAPTGRVPADKRMHLAIALPLRNQAALTELLRELYDPTSPRYRHYLTPAQFTVEFGPTPQDYEAVAAFARAHKLTVTSRYGNRLILDVEGAASDVENAMHVHLQIYQHPVEKRSFYAPDGDPSLDLAVPVAHIIGLDNYSLPKPRVVFKPAGSVSSNGGSGPDGNFMGNDFRTAYVPGVALTGSGQTVGLLQFDGYALSDIQTYEAQAGLPNVTCTNVLLDGYNGTPATTNGQIEVSLDIEMVISMSPGVSKIILYEGGPSGVWEDILNRMVEDNAASQISCSWFAPGQAKDTTADGIFQQMAAQGQSFYCASGDDDADTGLISFPEDTPYITEVGGTTLTTGSNGAWSSETAWNWNNGTGTGGGVSTQYTVPAWQQGIVMTGNGGSETMRNTPDVALTGNDVYVYAGGKTYSVGGTSCASPLWAGFTALVNQQAVENGLTPVGFINPAVYALADSSSYGAVFHDITTGNNFSTSSPNQFSAATGYDLCTGLGTPAGAALINALANPPDGLQVSFANLTAGGVAGGPFSSSQMIVTLTNQGSAPVTWTAGATQSWLSLSATSGTLAASGSTTVTASLNSNATSLATGLYADEVSFTDVGSGYIQTRPVALSIGLAPAITSGSTATVTSGAAFGYQITATNSPTSYGAMGLPAGLSVDTATGLISGATSLVGNYNIDITAANAGGAGSATLALTVLPPAPVITSSTRATARQGQAFTYQIAASNSPTSFGATGLPSSLSVNTVNGLISGTASSLGTSSVTITASNASGTGSAILTLAVVPLAPVITSSTNVTAIKGQAFTYDITATNNPTRFSTKSLPTGLTSSTATGIISGTPTATGVNLVTIRAINSGGTGSATLSLDVVPPAPVITSGTSAIATQGKLFTYQITASNTPTSFAAQGLPPGLSVTGGGLITGTAVNTGTSNITISAINLGGTGSAVLFLNVLPPPPAITSGTTATPVQGQFFSYQITATNNPTGFAATGLPQGLSLAGGGLITGTALNTGTGDVSISAVNLGGTGSALLFLNVLPPPPVITSATNATTTEGQSFSYQITATNNPSSFGASGLPAGLSLAGGGVISGAATATGTSNVILSAANLGGTGSALLVLIVIPPPPVILSGTVATATAGQAFSYQITATNGAGDFAANGLPAGLAVNPTTGLISGTTATTGTQAVAISAVNVGGTGTALLNLLIQTPYQAWQNTMFSSGQLSDATISGDDATPAGDGIPNLLKYALNLNPWVVGDSGLPVMSIVATGSGNYLTLTYPEVLSATDITYTVQVSTDAQTWNSGSGYTFPATPVGSAAGGVQVYNVQAVAPVGTATQQFIRLQVTGT